jgi:uncharacterized membrane protein
METATLLTPEQQAAVEEAIRVAEQHTSGEIRVHIEPSCSGNVLDRATVVFRDLEMHKTRLRNGVLFYVSVNDHKFAILGDAGINALVSSDFWDAIKTRMQMKFRAGHFADGIVEGVRMAGDQLQTHFPLDRNDENELPDKVSFGEGE